jgi:hypothetical protein
MDLNKPLVEQASDIQAGVSDAISGATNRITSGLSSLTSNADLGSASSEFINSNSIISKFVFLILVLIVFIMLMNLGVYIISYFLRPDLSPYVVKGLINGNTQVRIPQDPKNSNSVTIYRSNNASKGIEFTWSVWLNINELPSAESPIFNKGNDTTQKGPMMTLKKGTNDSGTISIFMDSVVATDNTTTPTVTLTNIPLNRWFNVAIRMQNKIMDVYVNGTVAKRYVFTNVPKQNYGDVVIGRFNGELSDLRYFNTALNVFQINNIAMAGPNMKSANNQRDSKFDYLSNIWFQPQA